MHYSINPEEIDTEIEKMGNTVANIWNIKQYRSKLLLSMFFVEQKPATNNKAIFNEEYIQQCKINPTAQTQKGYCSMCKLSKIWEHQKLLPSQTEMRQMCR
jgi:hypothetical protein